MSKVGSHPYANSTCSTRERPGKPDLNTGDFKLTEKKLTGKRGINDTEIYNRNTAKTLFIVDHSQPEGQT